MGGFVAVGPEECLVVSGMGNSRSKVIVGGRAFVWPVIQKAQTMSLNVMTLPILSPKVYTRDGVSISVSGVAQVKIEAQVEEMLRNALQQFLGKTPSQVQKVAHETLEGHQRAIMGTMTVEEIFQDRKKFAEAVFQVASTDLSNMGISIISYTIKDVSDDEGYLLALGMKRTAEVKRDAAVAEANSKRDAGIKQAEAELREKTAKFENDTKIAEAERDFELKKAKYDEQVQEKKADAQLAYQLQSAKQQQLIVAEEIEQVVVTRKKEIEVMNQEIARRERELEATVKKPAMAERYRIETTAQGEKTKVILEAEAKSEAVRSRADAEAFTIREKAAADAEQMQKKAEAFGEYQDAAMIDMILQTLPKIVAEVAAPLSEADKITMIGGSGEIGAAKLTGEVLDIVAKMPELMQRLTGIDIQATMSKALKT